MRSIFFHFSAETVNFDREKISFFNWLRIFDRHANVYRVSILLYSWTYLELPMAT